MNVSHVVGISSKSCEKHSTVTQLLKWRDNRFSGADKVDSPAKYVFVSCFAKMVTKEFGRAVTGRAGLSRLYGLFKFV
jgi:hypothetical protein